MLTGDICVVMSYKKIHFVKKMIFQISLPMKRNILYYEKKDLSLYYLIVVT